MSISGWLERTRQNHALEHATINLLTRRYGGAHVMGVSGPAGFTLYATLTAEEIVPAAQAALDALKAGDHALAIHENCGTNLVITAGFATLATILGLGYLPGRDGEGDESQRRVWLRFLERLPQAVLLNALALVFAAPVARWVQANVTTHGDVDDLEIASFFTDTQGGLNRVRVHTRRMGWDGAKS